MSSEVDLGEKENEPPLGKDAAELITKNFCELFSPS